ncbi:5592_t:CDS:2 [Acaulospora morrowiae]|uniref:5592_t:CDS:1 n=1 Tax=Acaulospora morrowiae TaxID=94023 RepID=A0A9N9NED1_9GLOM|nr:5592_t:CDS:2 [Acaulospora morrowiae]
MLPVTNICPDGNAGLWRICEETPPRENSERDCKRQLFVGYLPFVAGWQDLKDLV